MQLSLQFLARNASAFYPLRCSKLQVAKTMLRGMSKKLLRDVLAENLRALMSQNKTMGTPAKLARSCYWPKGAAKAGEPISQRLIAYMLDGAAGNHGPTLEAIEGVATGLGVDPLSLLASDDTQKVAAAYADLSPVAKEKAKDFIFMISALEATQMQAPDGLLRKS